MRERLTRLCLLLCLSAFTLAASEHHGVVKFGGLPLPGATVTATQGDKKFVAVTDGRGFYSFPDLADGVWTIQVDMQCFAPEKQEVAVAHDAPSPEWDMKLQTFDAIKASAPPPPAQTPAPVAAPATSAAPATAAAQPAEQAAKPARKGKAGAPPPGPAQSGFQRTDVNASSDAAPSIAAAETADQNQTASDAFIVNGSVSTGVEKRTIGNARKGPGSLYRGDLMAVGENSYLDARQFSLTGQNTAQPAYNHLRFGGSFGGLLYIPHILSPKGQFFVNYQAMRNRNASTASYLMPTEAERTGDFSALLNLPKPIQIINPSTGEPFSNNVIPPSLIQQQTQAQALLKFYPLPNFIDTAGYNYQVALVGVTSQDDLVSRVSRPIGRKDFLTGSFAYRDVRIDNPNVFGFRDHIDSAGLNTGISWRHMFSQRLNLMLGYNYSRFATRVAPFFANVQNVSGDAGITGNNQDPVNWGPPSLSFSSGIAGLSDAQESFNRNQTGALTGVVQWTHRPHNFTFGADLRRLQFNYFSQQNARGTFGFTGAETSGGVIGSGSDFADFLLGVPDTSSIAFGNADKYFRTSSYDLYFADDWRVGPTLSLNIGMRWEYSSPIVEKYGRLVNLDITPGFGAEAPVIATNPVGALTGLRYPDSLINPDKHGV